MATARPWGRRRVGPFAALIAGLAMAAPAGAAEHTRKAPQGPTVEVGVARSVSRAALACRQLQGLDDEFHVQVQFYRTIPGQPGEYSVHGPYAFVRERVVDGVRTLYHAGPGPAQETPLATMTSPDGWEIIGDPSGLWDILTVVPNES
jgi:hypothetical protein